MENDKKDIHGIKDKSTASFQYDPTIFHADFSIYILYRRIDNITAALFLITESLSETEMLKVSIRQSALSMLTSIVSFIGSPKADASDLQKVVAHILEVASKLNIAFWSGIVSEMNTSVLQKEILKIHETLAEVILKYRSKVTIDPLLFSRVDLDIRHHKNSQPIFNNQKLSIKDNIHKRHFKGHKKDNDSFNIDNNIGTLDNYSNNKNEKDERRSIILKLLSERSNLSIKDFSTVITRFSEKTIQRELLSLVEDGVIKKEGERRWSTYSLSSISRS